ncbi:hypothetical protein [Nocardioides aestuarii]|uniref:RNA polymerase subunit sigma-24 n=1 Tax=Nocardioides aestuarii TaxID=252231 RepID=A0ABW4TL02_9ACTN
MTDLYDATVDDVWRTARGCGASVDAASEAVTEAYVALWQVGGDVDHPRLWLMSRVHRTLHPEAVAA